MPSTHKSPRSTENQESGATRRSSAALARHIRKCAICRHPQREQIEDDFIRWYDPWTIVEDYELPSRSCLYRHVEARGLLARRRRNLRGVAERILENVDSAVITANAVLHAMRLFAHITEDGQWLELPKRAVITHVHAYPDTAAPRAPADSEKLSDAASLEKPAKQPVKSTTNARPETSHSPLITSHLPSDPARKELNAMLRGIHTQGPKPGLEAQRVAVLNQAADLLPVVNRLVAAAEARAAADDALTDLLPSDSVQSLVLPDHSSLATAFLIGTQNSNGGDASD